MQKEEKKEVVKKLRELFSSRDEFFNYLDFKASKIPNTDVLDFGDDKELKEIYAK